ncbi:MAG: DUF4150 domain-containing protein [Acetobacteraceae bacterium]
MPVTIQVNGTSLTLVHKFSNGISTATVPDVCKTPTPGGPVPTPYPNIAQSITLADGTTTVKGDKAMAANKGSKFALSNGDQAGTLGGVKSNVFMKEATWILYSFDVKLESRNACRLTDPMYHNAENTVNMAGVVQQALVAAGCTAQEAKAICDAFCKAQKKYDDGEIKGPGCCSKEFENEINNLKDSGVLGKGIDAEPPFFMGERGIGTPVRIDPSAPGNVLGSLYDILAQDGIDLIPELNSAGQPTRGFVREVCSYFKDNPAQRTVRFPDLTIERGGGRQVFDAKFSYESQLGQGARDKFTDDQINAYRKIAKPEGDPTALTPEGCGCPGY